MRVWGLALLALSLSAVGASAAPLVYTGLTASFSKEIYADYTLAENQDFILTDVVITRAETMGIFNITQEEYFSLNLSPLGTAWAFPFNNPGATLIATNWAALVFEDWQTAFGGPGAGGPPTTVDQDAVLHLMDQDIYLDIRFTEWGIGMESGGSFAYDRAELTPSADFDRDGDVDGRDFLTWQRGFGNSEALQTDGDADFDGVVTANDLAVWQNAYGSALTAFVAVPEPSMAFWFCLLSAAGMLRRSC
jgi:hypothetical protein